MNKKIAPLLLASSLVFQISAASFADELKEDNKPSVTAETAESVLVSKCGIELQDFIKGHHTVNRVSGAGRVDTSVEISKFENNDSEKVIIADASNYPDALSASTLSDGKYPVLLVNKTLSDSVKREIERLSANEAIILGGENSISKSIEEQIRNIRTIKSINRIYGKDRYETSINAFKSSGKKSIVVASGQNFPDALSASGLLKESGLILTKKNDISKDVNEAIKNSEKTIRVVGGQGSVSEGFYKKLPQNRKYETIAGSDRYSTSVEVAKKTNSKVAIIASGENFPDALAASTLSQMIEAPILLVSKDKVPASVKKYIEENKIEKAVVLGGEGTISEKNLENIVNTIEHKNTATEKEKTPTAEEKAPNKSIPNLKKDAVTKDKVTIYSDKDMTEVKSELPKNKIVDVIEQNDTQAKVKYYKLEGWVKKEELKNYTPETVGKVVNNVPYISQVYPLNAPNGCEATSLLMGLHYKGYTKMGLREFIKEMPKTKENPKYGFVGDPMKVQAGYYQSIDPEPLAKFGSRYGDVVNIQGQPIENIIKEIQNGNPVVMYVTLQFKPATYNTIKFDGKPTKLIWNTHVLLVTGYDPVKKSFLIADPYNIDYFSGNKKKPYFYWKSLALVDKTYNYMNRRFAVAIR